MRKRGEVVGGETRFFFFFQDAPSNDYLHNTKQMGGGNKGKVMRKAELEGEEWNAW